MERGTDTPGDQRVSHGRKRVFPERVSLTGILAALSCLILAFLSFGLVGNSSHAANLLRKTPTPVFTFTPTFTPTRTFTPTPTFTPTKAPTPRPTATNTFASTPTVIATATPRSTPTQVRATPTEVKTATSSINQTPTAVSGVPTTTHNSSSGTPSTGQPDQTGSVFGIAFSSLMMGALVFLGLASALLIGFLVIRKRLLPPQPINVNLPPSGAQPWKRVRSDSLHGNMTLAGESLHPGRPALVMAPNGGIVPDNSVFPAAHAAGSQTTMDDPLFLLPSTNGGFLVPNVGSQQSSAARPPYPVPTNENVQDISSSATNAAPAIGDIEMPGIGSQQSPFAVPSGIPYISATDDPGITTGKPGPITEKVETKLPTRPLNRPIRLQRQEVESAISPPTPAEQWLDRNSEEMLALDDPFLRNTLRQYILRGKLAREQRQQEEEERGKQ